MFLRVTLGVVLLCICVQTHVVPCGEDDESLESIASTGVKPFFSIEAVVKPIDDYLPEEYVPFIDDDESFGELEISEQDLEGPDKESLITDLVDKTKALLAKIKDYIVSKVRNVINTISKIEVNAKVIIDAGKASFTRKMNQVIEKARDAIKKKVAELKKDAKACLADSEKQFKEMLKKFLIGEEHCVTDEFHKAFDIAKKTKNIILNEITNVTNLPGQITTCLKGTDKFNCVKKSVWDVAKATEGEFKNFVSEFTSAASFVVGFESRVAKCALDELGDAGIASFSIVEKFPECVIGKVLKTK